MSIYLDSFMYYLFHWDFRIILVLELGFLFNYKTLFLILEKRNNFRNVLEATLYYTLW